MFPTWQASEFRRIKSNPALVLRQRGCATGYSPVRVLAAADAALPGPLQHPLFQFRHPTCKLLKRMPPVRSFKGRVHNQY
jgi:hypothetical protein